MSQLNKLQDEHHVMRHVGWNQLRKDENENVLGFLPEAFKLRPTDEGALSVNWLEYFGGTKDDNIRDSVYTFRRIRRVAPKSAFGIANVGRIKEVSQNVGFKVRVVHDPEPANQSHATILRLALDDETLFEALAADAFMELVHNSSIPQEPFATEIATETSETA